MENSSLDILVLLLFWKGSELDQRKIFLPNQEGKFHNISANHTAELKVCYFLRFLKFFIPTCHYFHSSQQILMIFRKLISVTRRERNHHLLEICTVMFTNLWWAYNLARNRHETQIISMSCTFTRTQSTK